MEDQRRINELNVDLQVQVSEIHMGKEEILETKTRCEIEVREAKLQLLECQGRIENFHDLFVQKEVAIRNEKENELFVAKNKYGNLIKSLC